MVVLPAGKVSHATGPKSPHFYHWDPSPNGPINVHPHSIPRRRPVPPPLDPRTHPFLSKVQRTWNKLSRLGKISLIAAIMLAFLALVIALPLGLMHHAHARPIPQAGTPMTGDLTYYDPGMGACGISSSNGQNVVAISHILFDANMINANPNDNPLCGKTLTASKGGASVVLTVVDRCVGCGIDDLDVTESAFSQLADPSVGRTTVNWSWN